VANRSGRYALVQFGWVLFVAGSIVVIGSGNAEPYVSASQLPEPMYVTGGLAVGLVVAGFVFVSYLKNRAWKAAADAAGLETESTSALSTLGIGAKPDVTGTVRGRPVTVRTTSRKTGNSTEGGSSRTTYTVVEADLAERPETGLILTRQPGGADAGTTDDANVSVQTVAVDDEFAAVGGADDDLARAVVSGTGRDDLLALDADTMVLVGNPVQTLTDAVPELSGGSRIGSMAQKSLSKAFPEDPTTVAIQTKGLLLDPEELERQTRAVVAAADGFEDATAGTARGASAETQA